MAIEQQGAAEAVEQQAELVLDRVVIGPVRLVEPLLELVRRNRAAPQIAVLLGARGNDSEPAARPSGHPPAPRTLDHRRVDFILGAIAVDRRAWRPGDHGRRSRA